MAPDGGIPSRVPLRWYTDTKGTVDMCQSCYVGHINSMGLNGPTKGAVHIYNLFLRTGLEMFGLYYEFSSLFWPQI